MSQWLSVSDENVGEYFEGVMLPVRDWDVGEYQVPGWKCKACGWLVGTTNLPPVHKCPDEGQRQEAERSRR